MIRLAMLHVQALLNFVTLFMGFFALANLCVYKLCHNINTDDASQLQYIRYGFLDIGRRRQF